QACLNCANDGAKLTHRATGWSLQRLSIDRLSVAATGVDQVLPQARKVMDPFHVVHLAADKLTGCRQRLQRGTAGRRGRKEAASYKHRRTILTTRPHPTER